MISNPRNARLVSKINQILALLPFNGANKYFDLFYCALWSSFIVGDLIFVHTAQVHCNLGKNRKTFVTMTKFITLKWCSILVAYFFRRKHQNAINASTESIKYSDRIQPMYLENSPADKYLVSMYLKFWLLLLNQVQMQYFLQTRTSYQRHCEIGRVFVTYSINMTFSHAVYDSLVRQFTNVVNDIANRFARLTNHLLENCDFSVEGDEELIEQAIDSAECLTEAADQIHDGYTNINAIIIFNIFTAMITAASTASYRLFQAFVNQQEYLDALNPSIYLGFWLWLLLEITKYPQECEIQARKFRDTIYNRIMIHSNFKLASNTNIINFLGRNKEVKFELFRTIRLDNSLVHAVLATVVGYSVILLQLDGRYNPQIAHQPYGPNFHHQDSNFNPAIFQGIPQSAPFSPDIPSTLNQRIHSSPPIADNHFPQPSIVGAKDSNSTHTALDVQNIDLPPQYESDFLPIKAGSSPYMGQSDPIPDNTGHTPFPSLAIKPPPEPAIAKSPGRTFEGPRAVATSPPNIHKKRPNGMPPWMRAKPPSLEGHEPVDVYGLLLAPPDRITNPPPPDRDYRAPQPSPMQSPQLPSNNRPYQSSPMQSPSSPNNNRPYQSSPMQSPSSPSNNRPYQSSPMQSPSSPNNNRPYQSSPMQSPSSPSNNRPYQSSPMQSPSSPTDNLPHQSSPMQSPSSPSNNHPYQSSPMQSPSSPNNNRPYQSSPMQSPSSPSNNHPFQSSPMQSPSSPTDNHPHQSSPIQSPSSPSNNRPYQSSPKQSPSSPLNNRPYQSSPMQSPSSPTDNHPHQSSPIQSPSSPSTNPLLPSSPMPPVPPDSSPSSAGLPVTLNPRAAAA